MAAADASPVTGRCHIAPAGCGKTTRIVRELATRIGMRSLVLTHTNAGVGVIRARLKEYRVPASMAFVSTIDGWCLRLVKAYPRTSGIVMPADGVPSWPDIRVGAIRTLARTFAREVVRASYGMVYVDEYQDCSLDQHAVVQAIASMVETHVFGDPLQGIFAFRSKEEQVVSWSDHIHPAFPVDTTDVWKPHRWAASPDLGRFVERLRLQIVAGGQVDLRSPGVALASTEASHEVPLLRRAIQRGSRTLVIRTFHQRCHDLAKRTGHPYRCIEPVGCPDLGDFVQEVRGAVGSGLPIAVLGLVVKCQKETKPACDRVVNHVAGARKRQAHIGIRPIVESCEKLMRDRTATAMVEVIDHFATHHAFRPELIRIIKDAARIDPGDLSGLPAAIAKVHEMDRRLARRMPWCCIGTTKLVKGLEADNVIVMDVATMDASDLYVALTRATLRLTIVTSKPVLPPPRQSSRVAQAIQAGLC
jgi:hypothetical protein